ncbi:RDD family protein [Microbacterium sp. G2-8]|uniref:RDD family protein n=1 Tax=Microbacterium sp. G2-8 TaxID=2842454 RepID=UPI001C894604|nr:RDD family protein [Microbacterium sp. G2-8]
MSMSTGQSGYSSQPSYGHQPQGGGYGAIPPVPPQPQDPAPQSSAPATREPLATIGKRVGVYVVDMLLIAFVVGVVSAAIAWPVMSAFLNGEMGVMAALAMIPGLVSIALIVVYTWMQGSGGSLAQRWFKVRLVRADSGARLGFGRALLRHIIWALAAAIIVGYFSVFFDRSGRQQGWHDKVGGALVIDVSGRGPAEPAPAPEQGQAPQGWAQDPTLAAPPAPPAPPAAPAYGYAAPPIVDAQAAPAGDQPAPQPAPAPADPFANVPPAPPAPEQPAADASVMPPAPGVPEPSAPPSQFEVPAEPIAFVPGVTGDPRAEEQPPPAVDFGEPAPAPAPASAPAPAPPAPVDDEFPDDTVVVNRRPAAAPEPSATLVWDDGFRVEATGRTVFGRNPVAEDGAQSVRIDDTTMSLSKTHFELTVTADQVTLTDRHSTNGVVIARHGSSFTATPGEPTPLAAGDELTIGDRTVAIERAGLA